MSRSDDGKLRSGLNWLMASLVMVGPLAWVGTQAMEGPLYVDAAAPQASHVALHVTQHPVPVPEAALVAQHEERVSRASSLGQQGKVHLAAFVAPPRSLPLKKIDATPALADLPYSVIEPYQLAVRF